VDINALRRNVPQLPVGAVINAPTLTIALCRVKETANSDSQFRSPPIAGKLLKRLALGKQVVKSEVSHVGPNFPVGLRSGRRMGVELKVYWSSGHAGGKAPRGRPLLPWSNPAISRLRLQIPSEPGRSYQATGISDSSLSVRRLVCPQTKGHSRSTVNRLSCSPVIRCFNQELSSLNCSSNEV
jgi:hypothetical protein